jgi:ubiquinone/menaquinone biosynthesis C-methylase UbiE
MRRNMTLSVPIIHDMILKGSEEQPVENELDVINRMLPLAGAVILELGCGAAEKTRAIAESTDVAAITAVEIDPIQHGKNLEITDLAKVSFKSYGAQAIPEADDSFDIVMMFKSLHHVPGEMMDQALQEIQRVLKPGSYAYISEPVFAGAFNEIMRLFHDEEIVRKNAFDAVVRAVDNGVLELEEEFFFKNMIKLRSFEQYEAGILSVTHSDHDLDGETLAEVKRRFMKHESEKGFIFEVPNRIDLLRKPG